MLFITDLDATTIYSREPGHICVEWKKDGVPITYMTKTAEEMLGSMVKSGDIKLIPCTARSYEQAHRISFINDEDIPVLICDSGFSIYKNGVLDKEWDDYIHQKVDTSSVKALHEKMVLYADENHIPIKLIDTRRDGFIRVIFHSREEKEQYRDDFKSLANTGYWFSEISRQLYVMPDALGKEYAVSYVLDMYQGEESVGSGDSNMDCKFVSLCSHKIIPKHADFSISGEYRTKASGIYAGEEIIKELHALVKK